MSGIDGGGPTPAETGIPQQDSKTEGSRSLWGKLTGKDTGRGKGTSLWKHVAERRAASEKSGPPKVEDVTEDIEKVRDELAGAGKEAKGATPPKDVVEELMPKVQVILTNQGVVDNKRVVALIHESGQRSGEIKNHIVDEAKMLRLMDEIEKADQLKGNVHTIGQGRDRAIMLRRAIVETWSRTAYEWLWKDGQQQPIPVGSIDTKDTNYLVLNRNGFIKVQVIGEQSLDVDPDSEAFAGSIHGVPSLRRYQEWMTECNRSTKNGGELAKKHVNLLLSQGSFPPQAEGTNREATDLFWDFEPIKPGSSYSEYLNPTDTEIQKRRDRYGKRWPEVFDYRWEPDFVRVTSPDFIQQALTANKALQPQN